MDTGIFIDAGIVAVIFLTLWLANFLVVHYKNHQANKELWATVFEGMTSKLIDLKPLKLPDTYIEKKAQRNGQGKDSNMEGR